LSERCTTYAFFSYGKFCMMNRFAMFFHILHYLYLFAMHPFQFRIQSFSTLVEVSSSSFSKFLI
jgi:hypothetical protein